MNIRVVNTLVKKDFKNCMLNKNLLISLLIPVFFCVLYRYLLNGVVGLSGTYVLQMCAIFAIGIVPTTILPLMIAEEKEKYTLRSLMLANVSGLEFLSAKLEVCVSLTFLDAMLVFFIAGGEMEHIVIYAMMILVSSLGLSFLGAVAGLLSKDQTAAGTIGMPLMLITMLPPLFSGMSEMLSKVAIAVPTTSFQTVFLSVSEGERLAGKENMIALAVCGAWMIVGYMVFHIFYKRKGIDV